MPLVATSGSVANCDLPEMFFLLLGLLVLTGPRLRPKRALAAGVSFGFAILCRETAVLALAGLAIPFIFGRPISRPIWLIVAAGAALVIGAEMLFQAIVSGDPLHRYQLALNHDSTISRAANEEGNLLVHPLLDPLLVLFANNEFGLLFPLAVVALFTGAGRTWPSGQREPWLLLLAMAASGFLLVALLAEKLVLNPRYFIIAAVAAVILVAIWLLRLPRMTGGRLLTGLIGSNLLLLSAQNRHPQWPAEALVRAAIDHPGEIIEADSATLHRADLPLRWNRLDNVRPLGSGGTLALVAEADAPPTKATLARYPVPPTPLGALLVAMQLDHVLPEPIGRRLISPEDTQLVVRVGGAPGL
jgi:hypothetical protein